MKSFFKYLLASMLGTIIVFFLAFFIFLIIIGSIVSKSEKPFELKANSILMLKLDKPIVDRKPHSIFESISFSNFKPESKIGLNNILDNIKKAEKDDRIKGIYLELKYLQTGLATVKEIRDALEKFKSSGKFVISHAIGYSQKSYYLASISDKLFMEPLGIIELTGLDANMLFFKGTFKKLGIEPQVFRAGKFKSAVEPFIEDKMSDANREQINLYLSSIWNSMVKDMADSRGIKSESIQQRANNLDLLDPTLALRHNFVDSLLYQDEIYRYLNELLNKEGESKPELVTLNQLSKVNYKKEYKKFDKEKIALIYASGEIMGEEDDNEAMQVSKIVDAIKKVRTSNSYKAIVFRVNSPGGYMPISEKIWRELELARKTMPVVASMGDVAASGGYHILVPADTIVANPYTLTGSIGVFGLFFNVQKFFNKKLGITTSVEKTNSYSDFPSAFRPISRHEKEVVQSLIDKAYDEFIDRVALGRKMNPEEVKKHAEGRVWSGINAREINLIDILGGMEDAVTIAAEMAKIEDYRIVELPKPGDPFEEFLKTFSAKAKTQLLKKELGDNFSSYMKMKQIEKYNGILTRLPFGINIY